MLNPDLYDDPFVANFISNLCEPEVLSISEDNLARLRRNMMATDDIQMLVDPILMDAQEQITTTGTLSPQFAAFPDKDRRISFGLESNIPTKSTNIRSFLAAGKALGFIRCSQCTFFYTMQPIENDRPAINEQVTTISPWGILIIGSSLRGNCFVNLVGIKRNLDKIKFYEIHQHIKREGQYYDYPFSKFFHIEDNEEMSEIIKQIPRIMGQSGMNEQECIINFATTLRSLLYFGYQKS